ncbi:MAG: hypothetical protein ACHP9Y_01330 [Gammaproteobacteria bacterium]
MNWPVSFIDSLYIMADILDITTSAGGQSLVLPPANQVSNGQQVLINNLGASNLTIYVNDAVTVLLVIPAGTSWLIYLTNNTTTNIIGPTTFYTGTWRTVPFAGGLAGVVTSVNATSSSNNLVIGGVPITNNGTITFALANDLLALSTFGAGTGYPARTAANTWALRTFTPVNANIAITNGAGTAGNTTIGLNNILVGLTSIAVGNLSLAANTISTTNVNGNLILAPNGTGAVSIINSTNAIPLRWYNAAGTFYDAFQAPALIQNNTWTLPLTDGVAGSALTTNGAGILSFSAIPNSGTITGNNRLINGDMQVWQRGAGGAAIMAVGAASNGYTADRWQLLTGANQACTVTQTAGATSGSWVARVQRNNAQTGLTNLQFGQSLPRELCLGAANNIATISFKAYAGANFSAAGNILTCSIIYGTGAADVSVLTTGFTGQAVGIAGNAVLTGALTNFTFSTLALPNTVTQLAVVFSWIPVGNAGADDSFLVTDCQLEISPVQTSFDRIGFQATLLKCYPYYQKSFTYGLAPAQNVGGNTGELTTTAVIAGVNINETAQALFIPAMRILPAFTFFNPVAANAQVRNYSAAVDCTNTIIHWSSARGFSVRYTGTAGTAVSDSCAVHFTAEGEIT